MKFYCIGDVYFTHQGAAIQSAARVLGCCAEPQEIKVMECILPTPKKGEIVEMANRITDYLDSADWKLSAQCILEVTTGGDRLIYARRQARKGILVESIGD